MPYANPEDRRRYERERARKRRSQGLCINCGSQATAGPHCQACRDKHNERRRKG